MTNIMSLPAEILKSIFGYFDQIDDIYNAILVCKTFSEIVPKAIQIINIPENLCADLTLETYKIPCVSGPLLCNLPNLKECHLRINPDIETLSKLLKNKTLNLRFSHNVLENVWLPYWLSPERTRGEFDSNEHTFRTEGDRSCTWKFRV